MDRISLALRPPRFVKFRRPPIRLSRSDERVWPLAAINGRAPVVLDSCEPYEHGVDLAYPRVTPDDAIDACPIGSPYGTTTHLMPAMTAVLAIADGTITFAGLTKHGLGVILDHGDGRASRYCNLQAVVAIRTDLYSPRPQHVRAGDVIGYVGAPEPDEFRRLHVELWRRDRTGGFTPIDPHSQLAGWTLREHRDVFVPAPPAVRVEAA